MQALWTQRVAILKISRLNDDPLCVDGSRESWWITHIHTHQKGGGGERERSTAQLRLADGSKIKHD